MCILRTLPVIPEANIGKIRPLPVIPESLVFDTTESVKILYVALVKVKKRHALQNSGTSGYTGSVSCRLSIVFALTRAIFLLRTLILRVNYSLFLHHLFTQFTIRVSFVVSQRFYAFHSRICRVLSVLKNNLSFQLNHIRYLLLKTRHNVFRVQLLKADILNNRVRAIDSIQRTA